MKVQNRLNPNLAFNTHAPPSLPNTTQPTQKESASMVVPCAYRAAAYIPSLVLERPVYLRETADGLFRPITYISHKIAEEVSLAVCTSLVFSTIVYFCVRLQVICGPIIACYFCRQILIICSHDGS